MDVTELPNYACCISMLSEIPWLRHEIRDIPISLPHVSQGLGRAELKAYEDSLDALLCAWVGIEYLTGKARAFGNETAAIWIAI